MSSKKKPTVGGSGVNQRDSKDSSSVVKQKKKKPVSVHTKTTEQIIQETSIKRHKAIKELANR